MDLHKQSTESPAVLLVVATDRCWGMLATPPPSGKHTMECRFSFYVLLSPTSRCMAKLKYMHVEIYALPSPHGSAYARLRGHLHISNLSPRAAIVRLYMWSRTEGRGGVMGDVLLEGSKILTSSKLLPAFIRTEKLFADNLSQTRVAEVDIYKKHRGRKTSSVLTNANPHACFLLVVLVGLSEAKVLSFLSVLRFQETVLSRDRKVVITWNRGHESKLGSS